MGTFGAVLFIIGTCIGAGFVSGAELVRFFGAEGFFLPVLLSGVVFFGLLVQALLLGKRYGGYEGVTNALFKRFSPAVRVGITVISLIPCAGLTAGFDALMPSFKPFPSLIGLCLVSLFTAKGMKGVGLLNTVLVPALVCFLFYFGKLGAAFSAFVPTGASGFFGGVLYAGMNTFLALPVLMDAGKEMKRPKLSAALAAAFIGACALFVLGAVATAGEGAIGCEMPFLFVMRGNVLFYLAAALAVATSLASTLYPLFCFCNDIGKNRKLIKYAASVFILLAAFALSRVGLSGIVCYFYPVLGILGLAFSAFCIFYENLFEKDHEKIHSRRQQTQQKRGAHHQVELEHLPAVDDKVPKSRF